MPKVGKVGKVGMSLPFFEHGARRMQEMVKPGMLCAFDFDGALAPTVKEPHRASIPPSVLRRMITLSEYARVAVVSGRSLADVGVRLDFLADFVLGNHGLEGLPGWEDNAGAYQALCLEWERQLKPALADRVLFDSGIWLENKTYSLSVHYRMSPDRAQAEQRLLQLFSALTPCARVVPGHCVLNLLPADAPDKASALSRLFALSGAPSAIYVGDDATDEELVALRRQGWLTVQVERSGESAAEFCLHHRLDVPELLDALVGQLGKARLPSRAAPQHAAAV